MSYAEPFIFIDLRNVIEGKFKFDKKSVLSIIGSIVNQVMQVRGAKTGDVGLNIIADRLCQELNLTSLVNAYIFNINPQTVDYTYNKLQTVTEYGKGMYDIEYFGDKLVNVPIAGTTGALFPPSWLIDKGILDPRLSLNYILLKHFEQFYLDSSQRWLVYMLGIVYLAFIENFKYGWDANNPRQIKYSMSLKVNPYFSFDIFRGKLKDTYKYGKIYWEDTINPEDILENNLNRNIEKKNFKTIFPDASMLVC